MNEARVLLADNHKLILEGLSYLLKPTFEIVGMANDTKSMPTQQRFKKILIVEDNIDLVHVLGLTLELQGYEIIRATDGKQAIKAVSLYRPDLILLDMSLPDIDGLEVAHIIRQDQINQSIRILAATGRGSFEYKEKCRRNGCDDYISKPFTPKQLVSRIKKLLM